MPIEKERNSNIVILVQYKYNISKKIIIVPKWMDATSFDRSLKGYQLAHQTEENVMNNSAWQKQQLKYRV